MDGLQQDIDEALHEAAEITRAAVQALQEQADTPEGRELAEGARRVRHRLTVQGENVVHTMEELEESLEGRLRRVRESASRRYGQAKEVTRETTYAVAEAGRRATKAPGKIRSDLSDAFAAWRQGLMSSFGLYAVAGALAVTTLVVFTVGIIGATNVWLGAPWGTLVVAAGYLLITVGAVAGAKAASRRGRKAAGEHLKEARDDARYVVEPLRDLVQQKNRLEVEA